MVTNITPEKSKNLGEKNEVYTMFFISANQSEEILKNHRAAIAACKSALKLLKDKSVLTRRPYRCGLSDAEVEKIWKKRLQFLIDECIML